MVVVAAVVEEVTAGIVSGSPRSAIESVSQQNERNEIHDFFEPQLAIHENDLLMMFMNVEDHEDMKKNENITNNEIITNHPDFNENESQNQDETDLQLLLWRENERGREMNLHRPEGLVADRHF